MTRGLEFDYVIVGGGSSGCVLAARLAAESGGSVALLERGGKDSSRWIHIPATFFKALQSQNADTVVSDPDPSLDGRPYAVPQGRVLGGGSSVNGMIYMRGQARDYDDWAHEHGCTGWAYADVLPVFRRQEANRRLSDDFHGAEGRVIRGNRIQGATRQVRSDRGGNHEVPVGETLHERAGAQAVGAVV